MNNKEVAEKIVTRMLDTIKAGGSLPWVKPWDMEHSTIRVDDGSTTITIPVEHWSRSGKPYQGINNLLLNMYGKSGEMITFNQCKAEGGRIKKGAKSATIVYWNMIKKEVELVDDEGNTVKKIRTIPVLKTYNVFSVEHDCEGLKTKHRPEAQTYTFKKFHYEPVGGIDESRYDPNAEAIIAGYLARAKTLTIECNGVSNKAFYRPSTDEVVVPNVMQFSDIAEYYSTMFHELGHSTGHVSRLDRFSGEDACAAFGSESYSREELVAEITAASMLCILGLESGNSFRNSAAYVQGWSKKLKDDPMLFITAAGRAEKALAWIIGSDNGNGGTTPPDAGTDTDSSSNDSVQTPASDEDGVKIPEGYSATVTESGNVIMVTKTESIAPAKAKAEKKTAARKPYTKGQVSAAKRVIRNAPDGRWNGIVEYDKSFYVTDGYRMIHFMQDLEELPRAEGNGMFNDTFGRIVNGTFNTAKDNAVKKLPLPDIDELKAYIKEQKQAKNKTALVCWKFDADRYTGVNAQFLLDMMQSMPGCEAFYPQTVSAPYYFTDGKTDGILLPVRMKPDAKGLMVA